MEDIKVVRNQESIPADSEMYSEEKEYLEPSPILVQLNHVPRRRLLQPWELTTFTLHNNSSMKIFGSLSGDGAVLWAPQHEAIHTR